jgi:hypothetical protein
MFSRKALARAALVALASALMVFAAAETAVAKKTKVSATITFTAPSHFSGKVSSKNAKCKNGAKVSLLYFTSSADTTADTVGKDKASKKGNWGIELQYAVAGEYEVMVAARKVSDVSCGTFVGTRVQF